MSLGPWMVDFRLRVTFFACHSPDLIRMAGDPEAIMKRLLPIIILSVIYLHCGNPTEALYKKYHEVVSSVGELDDTKMQKYIKTMRILRQEGINFQKWLEQNPDGGKDGFNKIESAIQEGGFEDYATFVKVNAKVAWAWNMAQAEVGMENQKNLNEASQDMTQQGIDMIDQQLADPNIPEETKAELRNTREQLVSQKQVIKDTWDENRVYADWAMEVVGPLTNDKEVALVKKYETELMEVFTGLSKEQIQQVHELSMPQLELNP